jgi:hypothetical protein
MAYRDDLKANLDVVLASSNVSTSSELPFDSSGTPLYEKNMKKVYLDEDNILREPLVETLDFNHVENVVTTVTAYLTIDAKNPIGDIDTITSAIINSKNAVSGQITRNCDMTTSFDADKLTYQFNFEFTTI